MSLLEIGEPRRPASLRLSRERKTALLPRFPYSCSMEANALGIYCDGIADVRETREPVCRSSLLSSTPILLACSIRRVQRTCVK